MPSQSWRRLRRYCTSCGEYQLRSWRMVTSDDHARFYNDASQRPGNVPVVFPISNFNIFNASGSASAGGRTGTECSPLMFAVDLTDCSWRVAAKRREQSIAAVCASSAHSLPRSVVSYSSRSADLSAPINSLLRLLLSSTSMLFPGRTDSIPTAHCRPYIFPPAPGLRAGRPASPDPTEEGDAHSSMAWRSESEKPRRPSTHQNGSGLVHGYSGMGEVM